MKRRHVRPKSIEEYIEGEPEGAQERLRELLHWLIQVIEEAFGTAADTLMERQLCTQLLN